ncbi:MAG: hypothetical protein ABJK25_04385 [Halieaceae bacterium]
MTALKMESIADSVKSLIERPRPGLFPLVFLLLILGLCLALGWYLLFSNFRAYDDEGILLMASKLFLEGAGFYTDVKWIYGPAQLFSIRWLHDWLSIPLNHSGLRYITLGYWLLLSTVGATVVFRLTRSACWALACLSLLFLFTSSIVNEPGHPQSLIAALTLCIPLVAHGRGKELVFSGWFLLGSLLAVIFHIKVNAGVFCLAAVGVALLPRLFGACQLPLLRTLLFTLSAASPFALMYPLLDQPHCLAFAALVSTGCAALALSVSVSIESGDSDGSSWLGLPVGFVAVSTAALTFAAVNGAYPMDIIDSLLSYSASQSEFYHYFRSYSAYQLASAGFSLVIAGMYCYSPDSALAKQIEVWGKCYFVLAAGFALLTNSPATAQGMIGYAAPWAWLLAVGSSRSFSRDLLAALSIWSTLLAYPIPGSQLYFGSSAVLVAALVTAADLFKKNLSGIAGSIFSQKIEQVVAPLAVGLAVVALSFPLVQARAQYLQSELLSLPGTGALAIEPQQARSYRKLVAQLKPEDTVFTTFRSNSLYFWSGASLAGTLHHAHDIAFASLNEQQRVIADLDRAAAPVVISRDRPAWAGPAPQAPIIVWIDKHFKVVKKIGPYTILKPKQWPPEDEIRWY